MDGVQRDAVLTAFNQQIRQRPTPAHLAETDGDVIRVVAAEEGWAAVTWSALTPAGADAAIRRQIDRFGQTGVEWEWKHYSYDTPPDLPDRLAAAGFTPEPAEALMVAEISELDLDVAVPAGVELRPVVDAAGVDALVEAQNVAFGGDHAATGRLVLAALADEPPTVAAVVAMAGDIPISGARMEFHQGTQFASLWGGGTAPAWRGRGVFRSLVAYRARLAAAAGFRYLQVDAMPTSRPILGRLGFVELATTTPYRHSAG
jgi:GNAT superfamily N-acetyltransferase